jgi:hypothetical protein
MTVSILVVDDEPDAVELFRQCFRREVRGGTYSRRAGLPSRASALGPNVNVAGLPPEVGEVQAPDITASRRTDSD